MGDNENLKSLLDKFACPSKFSTYKKLLKFINGKVVRNGL